jgi:hypothetical protein
VDVNVPIAATSMGEVKFQLFTQAGNATIIEKGMLIVIFSDLYCFLNSNINCFRG